MKRGRLNRGKPLGRGKPLERGAPMKRTGKVKPRSAKRAAEMPERHAIYPWLADAQGPTCAWPKCTRPWADPHEILTRGRGGSHVDRRIIIGLCREHNTLAGDDPRRAECLGVVVPSWSVNTAEVDDVMAVAVKLRARVAANDPHPCPWRRNGEPCTSPDGVQRERCDRLA